MNFNRQPSEIRWLTILLYLSFFCDALAIFLVLNRGNPNHASSLFWISGLALLSGFFYHIIGWSRLKAGLIFINVAYFVFAVANFLVIQKSALNSYTVTIESIIVLTLSILYFYKLLRDLPTQQLQKLPLFWIVAGFFFTYAGKLVVYTVTDYLIRFQDNDLEVIWTFHNFLTVIANLLIGYGAWLNHKKLRSTSLSL
jgi:hypothetical protein